MNRIVNNPLTATLALAIVLATLVHIFMGEVSIFHGIILHPIFLLIGLSFLAYYGEKKLTRKK